MSNQLIYLKQSAISIIRMPMLPLSNQFEFTYNFQSLPASISMRFFDSSKDAKRRKRKVQKESPFMKEKYAAYENILMPDLKVRCDSCEKNITRLVKICVDSKDYCVSCFACRDSWPEKYTVVNKLNFPVFDVDWTAEEELLMLEAISKHGFGNWDEIAYQIGTDKTSEQVKNHYQAYFIDSPNFIPANQEILTRRDPKTFKLSLPENYKIQTINVRRITQENNSASVDISSRQRITTPVDGLISNQTHLKSGHGTEVVGFMPKRGDFQIQYDCQAELLLAEMQFNEDDNQEETEMKFKIIQIYNQRLTERIKRKQFVITRQLLDVKLQSQLEKKRGKQERELYNAMKVFARFNLPEDHQKIVQGLVKERQIRQRITELKQFRKMGMKSLAEVEEYLKEERKNDEKKKRMQRAETAYLFNRNKNKNNPNRRQQENSQQAISVGKKFELLPLNEVKLCEDVGLTPSQYVIIKETLIRQSLKNGFIKKDSLNGVLKVDKEKIHGIFDFLVKNGEVHLK